MFGQGRHEPSGELTWLRRAPEELCSIDDGLGEFGAVDLTLAQDGPRRARTG